ncbi:MAG TPA: hypothetical protein VKT80_14285 [Chloroflexota bacterium]|nr:hypothetical protein [Chloroflexota bacterium]
MVAYAGFSYMETSDWREFGTVLEVACKAKTIRWGFNLRGPGKVWVDDVTAEFGDDYDATPGHPIEPLPGVENLDFEH